MGDDIDDEWANYQTGPFCVHWGALGDCDYVCECGHTCNEHNGGFAEDPCRECECQRFSGAK